MTVASVHMVIKSHSTPLKCDAADITAYDNFGLSLQDKVGVNLSKVVRTKSKTSPMIDHFILIKKRVISSAASNRTVKRTKKCGVCTVLHPSSYR